MSLVPVERLYGIRIRPKKELVEYLTTEVLRFERKFGLPTESMFRLVDAGQMDETAEVCEWMQCASILRYIRGRETQRVGQQVDSC